MSTRAVSTGNVMALAAFFLALLLFFHATSATAQGTGSIIGPWTSRGGELQISYASNLHPLIINQIHSWVLYVETSKGTPVADAELAVEGGMPEHDHGLPTRPRVTRYLGDGKYLLEGMRFHMPGAWEIHVAIDALGKQDVVIISLTL
jgi:hypothetical protein